MSAPSWQPKETQPARTPFQEARDVLKKSGPYTFDEMVRVSRLPVSGDLQTVVDAKGHKFTAEEFEKVLSFRSHLDKDGVETWLSCFYDSEGHPERMHRNMPETHLELLSRHPQAAGACIVNGLDWSLVDQATLLYLLQLTKLTMQNSYVRWLDEQHAILEPEHEKIEAKMIAVEAKKAKAIAITSSIVAKRPRTRDQSPIRK